MVSLSSTSTTSTTNRTTKSKKVARPPSVQSEPAHRFHTKNTSNTTTNNNENSNNNRRSTSRNSRTSNNGNNSDSGARILEKEKEKEKEKERNSININLNRNNNNDGRRVRPNTLQRNVRPPKPPSDVVMTSNRGNMNRNSNNNKNNNQREYAASVALPNSNRQTHSLYPKPKRWDMLTFSQLQNITQVLTREAQAQMTMDPLQLSSLIQEESRDRQKHFEEYKDYPRLLAYTGLHINDPIGILSCGYHIVKKEFTNMENEFNNKYSNNGNHNSNSNSNNNNNTNNRLMKEKDSKELEMFGQILHRYRNVLEEKYKAEKVFEEKDKELATNRRNVKYDEMRQFGPIDICYNEKALLMRNELNTSTLNFGCKFLEYDKNGDNIRRRNIIPDDSNAVNAFRRKTDPLEVSRYRENMAYLYGGTKKFAVAPLNRIGDTGYQLKRWSDYQCIERIASGVYGYVVNCFFFSFFFLFCSCKDNQN